MAPIIKEVTNEAEFSAVVDCFWNATYNPYTSFMNILFPIWEPTEEGYAKALAESKTRLWSFHINDPSSRWLYVTDDSDGKNEVYSGAHWNFHKDVSPYKDGAPQLVAAWYPEGEGRVFASRVLNQIYRYRGMRLWRPHAREFSIYLFVSVVKRQTNPPIPELDYMFTEVRHRRKGYASMLMQWGMDHADEMGLEVVVEASDQGVDLYRKFGLTPVDKIAVDMHIDNPSNTWRKMESDFGTVLITWMWKPHGGVIEEGKTEFPWLAKRPGS